MRTVTTVYTVTTIKRDGTREINIVTENKESDVVAKSLRLIPGMHNDMTDQDILDRVSTETPATVGIRSCVVLSQPNSPPVDTSNQINIVASKLEQVVQL